MAYNALFVLLLLLISKAAAATVDHQCPAATSASGIAEFQEVATVDLDYCVVDDCTIQRTDTGEQLDIIYTTDSLLVVTNKGNENEKWSKYCQTCIYHLLTGTQTSVAITMNGDEPPCQLSGYLVIVMYAILIVLVDSYIFLVNILVKEKRTAFGLLLVLYSGSILFTRPVSLFGESLLMSVKSLNTLPVCYIHLFFFMQGIMVHEAFAVCVLAHIAFIMYYSDKLQADFPNTKLFKRYTVFVGGMRSPF